MNDILKEAAIRGNTLALDLWYPRIEDNVRYIELGLVDVRAADNIRISYDFNRDGYVIEQDAIIDDEDQDDWQEVAFVQAWAREIRSDNGVG